MKKIQVAEKNNLKGGGKLKNNKGFSLVELLIVVAIMGILIVLSFNVFGNVLKNSKEKTDYTQAANIAKSIQTYCIETDDWGLSKLTYTTPESLIGALTVPVTPVAGGQSFGPYVQLKDANKAYNEEPNVSALKPTTSTFVGWKITVSKSNQSVSCAPTTVAADAKVTVN